MLGLVGLPGWAGAEDGFNSDPVPDSLRVEQTKRVEQTTYFSESIAPADPRLHEAVVTGLTTGERPELRDDFLLTLRRTRQDEGTIFVWDRALTRTDVAGAHLNEYILFVLPFTLDEGEHRIPFGDASRPLLDNYAIYASTEIGWTPLFSCIGLAIDGVVTLNKISPKKIEAKMDISFEVVSATEWKPSDYCAKEYIEADITFFLAE